MARLKLVQSGVARNRAHSDIARADGCSDGSPLTKAFFVASVRQALVRFGVNPRSYAGHSFRIGAAMAAAEAGVEDSVIQSLGRWNSTAFLRYIRTPRETLAAFTSQLAAVDNHGR